MEATMNSNPASVETLKAVLDAFNAHDLDRIVTFLSGDCILEMPRGPDPWGMSIRRRRRRKGWIARETNMPSATTHVCS
jgi:ketosteroid isomerase-like protein